MAEDKYRCEECGYKNTFDPYVAPDEPRCPKCWDGDFETTPIMRPIKEQSSRGN